MASLLRRLRVRLGGALAIVSGRKLSDIDRLLGDSSFPGAGQHGAELRLPGGRRRQAAVPTAMAVARAALASERLRPRAAADRGQGGDDRDPLARRAGAGAGAAPRAGALRPQ
jgi:hypothetical protein